MKIAKFLWLICLALGLVLVAALFLSSSKTREETNLFGYAVHIAVFLVILLGVSLFPNDFKGKYLLLTLPVVAFLGFVSPKMSYFAINHLLEPYYSFETTLLFPLVAFSICFAYRLGGGKSEHCFKTGVSAIILLFSGFIDLMWFIANGVNYQTYKVSIPHIRVIIGHEPSFVELLVFLSVHLALLVAVNLIPVNKFFSFLDRVTAGKES